MPSSDPTANLMPNKPKDFIAFVNLVDFCRCHKTFPWHTVSKISEFQMSSLNELCSCCPLSSELLPSRNPEYFSQWMYPLCHELILQSIRFPLVSGFYKLLSLSMGIAKKAHYFEVIHVHTLDI